MCEPKNPVIIKAGKYEDLPIELQQSIDRVAESIKKPRKKHCFLNPDLEQKIIDILNK